MIRLCVPWPFRYVSLPDSTPKSLQSTNFASLHMVSSKIRWEIHEFPPIFAPVPSLPHPRRPLPSSAPTAAPATAQPHASAAAAATAWARKGRGRPPRKGPRPRLRVPRRGWAAGNLWGLGCLNGRFMRYVWS